MYHASETSDDFSVGYDWEIDETSGKVTARTRMRCPDAGFWIDHAWVWVDAVQVFQYTAPRTGRLSVIVELVNLEGRSEVALADEFGLSSSNTNLRNYMTLRVYHPAVPDISFAEMSHMSRTGTSGTVAESNHYPGSTYLATLESQGTVAGRRHLLCRGGHTQFRPLRHGRRRSHDGFRFQLADPVARAADSRRRPSDSGGRAPARRTTQATPPGALTFLM